MYTSPLTYHEIMNLLENNCPSGVRRASRFRPILLSVALAAFLKAISSYVDVEWNWRRFGNRIEVDV